MKNLLMNALLRLRRIYWWIFRPVTRGVRAILVGPKGDVLLVRHSYGEGWYLPGGRMEARENEISALRRELREELGVEFQGEAKRLGEYDNTREYKRDTIIVFIVESFSRQNVEEEEIEEAKSFAPNSLPSDVSPGTRRRIEEWLGSRKVSVEW